MLITKFIRSFISNKETSILFLIAVVFLPLSASQAKEAVIQDILIDLNKKISYYSGDKQKTFGDILHRFNHKLIKTGLNKKDELVFILAGQSNMRGYGTTAKLPATYRRTPSNVQFYFNGYPAKMSHFAHFGPEVGFAHVLSRRFPNKTIKLIKFAVGGTSLFAWDPHWQLSKAKMTGNASAGPLFKKLIKTIKRHSRLKSVKYTGILWMQGEEDSRHSSAARTYSQNLSEFIRALRKELHAPSLAFFIAEVDPPIKAFPYRDIVRKAQRNSSVRIQNSRLISTQGLEKQQDNLHYNTAGQLALGIRFAKAFIQTAR